MFKKRIKAKMLFLLIMFLSDFFVFSQSLETDDFYLKKLYTHTDSNNDSILYYAEKLKYSKVKCNMLRAVNFEAKAYYQKGNFNIATEKSLFVLKSADNETSNCYKLNKLTALNRLFWIYKNQNKYQKAFEAALKRKEITESLDRKDVLYNISILSVYYNLAIIKNIMGYHKETRVILNDALPKLPKTYFNLNKNNYYANPEQGDYFLKLNQSSILNLIGKSYLNSSINNKSKDLDSASIYFKKAFEVAKKFNPLHEDSETLYQIREAKVLISKKNFLGALSLVQKFSKNSKKFKTEQNINSLKAICFYQLKNSDSAIYYSKKYLSHEKLKAISKKKLTAIYDVLANQYYKDKEIDSAFKYSELTVRAINALNKSKSKVNKSHYLHDFKDAQALNKIILTNYKNDKNLFIIYGIISLLITLFIIISSYIKNKKTTHKYHKINNQIKNTPTIQKKVYHLDKDLEYRILKGIRELEETKDYLDASFTIHVLAKKINTNTSYLSYTFNKVKNKSFKQYITALRIQYLIKKLEEDKEYRKYTIKYLAEEIGYTNASAFTRAFKKHQGVTPSEFIKSLCKKN